MGPEYPIYGYLTQWSEIQKTASSERVRTRHHMRRFLRKSLALKINPNTGQMTGTTDEGKKKNMTMSEGDTF